MELRSFEKLKQMSEDGSIEYVKDGDRLFVRPTNPDKIGLPKSLGKLRKNAIIELGPEGVKRHLGKIKIKE